MVGKTKPNVSKEKINEFLHGYNPIEYIRYIHTSSYNNEAILYRRPPESNTVFTEKMEYTPFLWVKDFPNDVLDNFFRWKTVNVFKDQIENDYVFYEGRPLKIDNIHVKDLGDNKFDNNFRMLSFYLETEKERLKHYESKKVEYNIDDPLELITHYQGEELCERMKNSFKYLFRVKKPEKARISTNPIFQYNKEGKERKINGSFNNLLDFFKEGGLDPTKRSGTYINISFFKDIFKTLKQSEQILLFLNIAKHLKNCDINFFTKESVNIPLLLEKLLENETILKEIVYKAAPFRQELITKEITTEEEIDAYLYDKFLKVKTGKHKLKEKDLFDYLTEITDKKTFLVSLYNEGILDKIFNLQINLDTLGETKDYDLESKVKGRDFLEFLEQNNLTHITENFLSLFYYLASTEQFMIQTGLRLFKGIDDYSSLKAFVFDIETTALPEFISNKEAALSPKMGYIFKIGIFSNNGYEKILEANNTDEEKLILEEFFDILGEQNPDLLLTYNGEHFDFRFMEQRMRSHKMMEENRDGELDVESWIRQKMRPYLLDEDSDVYLSDWTIYNARPISLKVGSTIEDTMQTSFAGINCCDTYFSVKRAAAIDSKIENLKLKYNIKYAKVQKPNRVYVDGDKIGQIGESSDTFILNNETGEWFNIKKQLLVDKTFDRSLLKIDENGTSFYKNFENLFIYNKQTDHFLNLTYNSLSFDSLNTSKEYIDNFVLKFYDKIKQYKNIVVSNSIFDNIRGTESHKVWKQLFASLKESLNNEELLCANFDMTKFEKVTGRYIVNRYLEDDLWETYKLDEIYSQASFLLAKWSPTTYQRITTMGTASVWKLLLSAWAYENSLAIPSYEAGRTYPGAIVGMVSSGYHKDVVKLDYSGLYPAEFLCYVATPDFDITDIMKAFVRYGVEERLYFKDLKKQSEKKGDYETAMFYDKKQLPLKILNNSFYGLLGAYKVSPFSHIDSAHHITALGRQHIRHLIKFGEKRCGLKAIYFHTDGVNLVLNDKVKHYIYIGKGLNWTVTADKKYTGIEALVAEFNDLYMRDKMAVGIDEMVYSCINFAKGNFIYLKEKKDKDGTVKIVLDHVGGAIIKKNQSEFVVDFIEQNTTNLLLGNGQEFIQKLNEYVLKIKNQELIAKKIASKARVTKSMQDYLTTSKVKQAHMELLRNANITPEIGDWIYYVNTGKKKTDSDYTINKEKIGTCTTQDNLLPIVNKKVTNIPSYLKTIDFKYRKVKGVDDLEGYFFNDYNDKITFEIKKEGSNYSLYKKKEIINCFLVDVDSLYSRVPYNIDKYLHQFKTSISPLMVAFTPTIREKINREDLIASFEVELCSGVPLDNEQDDLIELMKITPEEQYIWDKLGCDPIFLSEWT